MHRLLLAAFGAEAVLEPLTDAVHPSGRWIERRRTDAWLRPMRRLDGTYSWGAAKDYSVAFDESLAHTHGGKTVLVTRYKPTGVSCDGCDTVMPAAELSEIMASGNRSIVAMSYGATWIESWTVVPGVLAVDSGNFFVEIDNIREAAYAAGHDFSR